MFFDLGIELKRVEVISDDEAEIIEAVQRMAKNYDLVVTVSALDLNLQPKTDRSFVLSLEELGT